MLLSEYKNNLFAEACNGNLKKPYIYYPKNCVCQVDSERYNTKADSRGLYNKYKNNGFYIGKNLKSEFSYIDAGQNYGKFFSYLGTFYFDNIDEELYFYISDNAEFIYGENEDEGTFFPVYSEDEEGSNYISKYNLKPGIDYIFWAEVYYNSSIKQYEGRIKIYDYNAKKWIVENSLTANTSTVSSPQNIQSNPIVFYIKFNFRLYFKAYRCYNCELTEDSVYDYIYGKIHFDKNAGSLYATEFNEYVRDVDDISSIVPGETWHDEGENTTFFNDGTIWLDSQIIENEKNSLKITEIGNINAREFIEY